MALLLGTKFLFVSLLFLIVIATVAFGFYQSNWDDEAVVFPSMYAGPVPILPVVETESKKNKGDLLSKDQLNIGSGTVNMEVSFTSQAPFGVWDHLHDEACEEASVLMAHSWANNFALNPAISEAELKKMVEWQMADLGFFESTTAEQTARMAREVYGLKVDLLYSPTLAEVKKEVSNGSLVVMGMAGKLLGNPHFRAPGPIYHMLVIKGYNETGFLVNDPGTKYGANYFYSYDTIREAAHDWAGSEERLYSSPAVALVISK